MKTFLDGNSIDKELLPIMAKAEAMINEMHSIAEVAAFKYGGTLAIKAFAGVKTENKLK